MHYVDVLKNDLSDINKNEMLLNNLCKHVDINMSINQFMYYVLLLVLHEEFECIT